MKYLPCQPPIQFAGEIHGTLHRKVLENYQTELAPGAGLILKHVSVNLPVKCLTSVSALSSRETSLSNSLSGLLQHLFQKLQYVQNAMAHILTN